MRNLSFALTTAQMRARTKTVTRRLGSFWWDVLEPGELVCAVEKSQGVKKGGIVRIGVIRIVSVRLEPLNAIDQEDVVREGFGGDDCPTPAAFVAMFCSHMRRARPESVVSRIEFEHVDASA